MQTFTYLKDGETTPSTRVLTAVKNPSNLVSALDLTGLSADDAAKAERLYSQWQDEVYKPYAKQETAFRKANLQDFEAFAKAAGLETPPMVKHFKANGLTPVA